ncbi:MAG TPA: phosphatase PAP2 family protein [Candidatus Limnocylindrales bacterium]|nr:phosphatase PAP2 family protein [Candidatus Limnocylindrales bacterium]
MNSGLRNGGSGQRGRRKPVGSQAWWWVALFVLCFAQGIDAYAGDAIKAAGDILQYVIPATAGGLTLGYRDYKGTLQFGESVALTEGLTYGLKYTVNETRPDGGSQSFPSGHASISFCGAEFIRKRYGWELGIPAYAAASFVAYSRVEANEHYPHDVIAGAAIGMLSSFIFTKPYKGWEVKTEAGPGLHGLFLSKSW